VDGNRLNGQQTPGSCGNVAAQWEGAGRGGQYFVSLSSAELYDPATETWTATALMSTARYCPTATLLPNGQVLVAGGGSSSAELYDPATGMWTDTGPMNIARMFDTATLLPTGRVLVAAGEGSGATPASAELYDPATGTWTTTGSLTTGRKLHMATLLPNGNVMVAGGAGNGLYRSAELYDPAAGTGTVTGSLATARVSHTATLLTNGKVLVAGGSDTNPLASAELYDFRWPLTAITLTGAANVPGGAFQFAFTNIAGARFTVLATTNASLALSNWTVLGQPTEGPAGHFQFSDPQATNNARRFYRVRSP
jgi:hypothetical protein